MKIVIVGAGVSGMLAASILKEKHEVILIEKNSECGKKILATGNGKCNFWHTNLQTNYYQTDNVDKLNSILSKNAKEKTEKEKSLALNPLSLKPLKKKPEKEIYLKCLR